MTYQPKEPIKCLDCDRTAAARKLCRPCYNRHRGAGTLSQFRVLGPQDVFWGKVEKTDTCWLWSGTRNKYGYGVFLLPGEKPVRAHRHSYALTRGPIPDGLVVMHACDNPACVNPDHLSLGTKLDNNRDAARKDRNARGERNGHAKLTAADVQHIRTSGASRADLAFRFGVDPSTISQIIARKKWRHIA